MSLTWIEVQFWHLQSICFTFLFAEAKDDYWLEIPLHDHFHDFKTVRRTYNKTVEKLTQYIIIFLWVWNLCISQLNASINELGEQRLLVGNVQFITLFLILFEISSVWRMSTLHFWSWVQVGCTCKWLHKSLVVNQVWKSCWNLLLIYRVLAWLHKQRFC